MILENPRRDPEGCAYNTNGARGRMAFGAARVEAYWVTGALAACRTGPFASSSQSVSDTILSLTVVRMVSAARRFREVHLRSGNNRNTPWHLTKRLASTITIGPTVANSAMTRSSAARYRLTGYVVYSFSD